MRLYSLLSYLIASPYFSRNTDYLFFNKPLCFINLKRRQTILSKWYNYDQQKIYRPVPLDLPHTFIWSPEINKTQHVQYMVIGVIKENIFEVRYIIPRPYIIDGNMLELKSDLVKYTKPLRIRYKY